MFIILYLKILEDNIMFYLVLFSVKYNGRSKIFWLVHYKLINLNFEINIAQYFEG